MFTAYGAGLLLLLFLAAALIAGLTTRPLRRLAMLLGCVDYPSERKLHERATPRFGGLAIVLGFSVPLVASVLHPSVAQLVHKNTDYLFAVLISGGLILILGMYDDMLGSNAWKKFGAQTAAAIVVVAFGFKFDVLYVPGLDSVSLGWFGAVVTVLWIVGVINAVNFIDGMDELATLVSITTAASLGVIAFLRGDAFTLVVMTALGGSLVGFYPWNRRPAKVFMGDTGSMFIGLLLATCTMAKATKAPAALLIGGPMLALALPVVDTLFVMSHRLGAPGATIKQRLFRMVNADRTHLHHILTEKVGSESKAVSQIWSMSALFCVAAIVTVIPGMKAYGYLLAAASLLLIVAARSKEASAQRPAALPAHPLRRRTDVHSEAATPEPAPRPRKPPLPAVAALASNGDRRAAGA